MEALNAAKLARRELRRRAHRPLSQQLRLHARAADRQRRRHRLDRRRRSRARGRHVGLRGDARPHEGRRRRRRARSGRRSPRRTASRATEPVQLAPAHVVSRTRRWKTPLHDRSVHDPDRAEGRPAPQGERRGDEGDGREVRVQRTVLREGRAELREHRRLGDHADDRSQSWLPMQITAVAPDFSDFQNRAQRRRSRRAAARSTSSSATSSETRGKWAEEAAQKLKAKPVDVGPLRSRAASVAPLAHDPRVDRAPDGARSRDGLRGELRRHELRRAAREDARQVQVRPRVHEHSGRPLAGRRLRDDRLR